MHVAGRLTYAHLTLFSLTIHHFDYAVQDINTEKKYFIAVDMCSGYWQVVAEEEEQ